MGPGDQPAFGGAGGLWQPGVVIPAGGVPLAMSLLAFARLKKRPMRQPGQKAVTGRVASHTRYRLVPFGRTTRPVRPLEFQ